MSTKPPGKSGPTIQEKNQDENEDTHQMFALIEFSPQAEKILYFEVDKAHTKCEVEIEYYANYYWYEVTKDTIRTTIDVYDHNYVSVWSDVFSIDSDKDKQEYSSAVNKKLKLDMIGIYKIQLRNVEDVWMFGSITVSFSKCVHDTKLVYHNKHAGKNDLDSLNHKVEKMVAKLFHMLNLNTVTDTAVARTSIDINWGLYKLIYTASSEIFSYMCLVGWQIWYIKSLLDKRTFV